jgi:hypothetical protein
MNRADNDAPAGLQTRHPPSTPYSAFVALMRAPVQSAHPNAKEQELRRLLSYQWRVLAPNQRTFWHKRASDLNAQYDIDYAAYINTHATWAVAATGLCGLSPALRDTGAAPPAPVPCAVAPAAAAAAACALPGAAGDAGRSDRTPSPKLDGAGAEPASSKPNSNRASNKEMETKGNGGVKTDSGVQSVAHAAQGDAFWPLHAGSALKSGQVLTPWDCTQLSAARSMFQRAVTQALSLIDAPPEVMVESESEEPGDILKPDAQVASTPRSFGVPPSRKRSASAMTRRQRFTLGPPCVCVACLPAYMGELPRHCRCLSGR